MSRKPETVGIAAVHRHLKEVHHEKMNNPYRSGTADVWYSGKQGDLWVEYKFIQRPPKFVIPDLSTLQKLWLKERYLEGRNVAVIVLSKGGGVRFRSPEVWEAGMSREHFLEAFVDNRILALWIKEQTGECVCLSAKEFSLPPE